MSEQEKKQNMFEGEPGKEPAHQEEIDKLREEIAEMKKQLAEKGKETAGEVMAEQMPGEPQEGAGGLEISEPAGAPQPQATAQQISAIDPANQVKFLCDLAFQKGVDAAIEAAKNLDNPYVLDEFHDTLIDELYERLRGEGKIEEI